MNQKENNISNGVEEENIDSNKNESVSKFFWEVAKIIIIAAVVVIPIRYFLFQPFFVRGQSMDPNFENGDYLIIDELSYRLRTPERGEVIVFKYPVDPSNRFIKRIIGLPGETVEIKENQITIYLEDKTMILDEKYLPDDLSTSGEVVVELKADEYFVLGDNRPYSFDSRRFGPLHKSFITGRVLLRAWPIDSISIIKQPSY